MTRRSMHEYAQELRSRYFKATKGEKGKILDGFTQVTGLHRKAAIRLLNRRDQTCIGRRRGTAAEIQRRSSRGTEVCMGSKRSVVFEASASVFAGDGEGAQAAR